MTPSQLNDPIQKDVKISIAHQASIDIEGFPGNVSGMVIGQENNGAGDFFRLSQPPKGDGIDNLLQDRLADGTHHFRIDVSWRYGVNGNSLFWRFRGPMPL